MKIFSVLKKLKGIIEKEEAFYISFGWIYYFLVIEDEKPVLYANACSRMDLDIIAFIDENGSEEYSLWEGKNPEIRSKYNKHTRKVKRFDYDKDLKFINDV